MSLIESGGGGGGKIRTPFRDADMPEPTGGPNPLDRDPKIIAAHQWLLGAVMYEQRRQAMNRREMALDVDYYDGIQFSDEDLQELLDRGQAPLVYNLVKRTADWVIGTEKRTRFDYKVLGRTQDDVQAARMKTDALKYHDDVNRTVFARSAAFKEAIVSGRGWLEDGCRGDSDEEPLYSTNESWWFMWNDSHAMKLDNTDARYIFRHRYADLDIAEAMFPERMHVLRNDVQNGSVIDEKMGEQYYLGNRITGEDYLAGRLFDSRFSWMGQGFVDSSRDRVKLYEGWFKQPKREKTMQARALPQFHGEAYDPSNDDMRYAVLAGDATLVERMNMRTYYCIFTESGVLAAGRSPYRHNQFPFTPITCYRRGRDNAAYGIIRGIRDPQDGFNRRMAKSIFAHTAYRVIADSTAIDEKKAGGWEEVRKEAGRPDALIVKKSGTELKVERDHEVGEAQFKIAQAEGSLILDASGVTGDNLGLETNAQSGKAIIAKQSEGSLVMAEPFDNLRLSAQISGEKKLSNIEQYWSEEKILRLTDAKGRPSYKKINQIEKQPDGSVRVLNDITATKADFVIDQQDYHASLRQAASQALMENLPRFAGLDPKITLRILRMAVDASDWPNKDEIVKELDSITGYKDPSAALTPEEQAAQKQAEAQQQQAQKMQEQQQQAAFKAELDGKIATAERLRADAQRLVATAEKTRTETMAMANTGQAAAVHAAVSDVQAQAQQQIDTLTTTIEDLKAQGRDNSQKLEAEKYKADKQHESSVRVAEIQYPTQPPTDTAVQELVADMQQDMASVLKAIKELGTRIDASEKKEDATKPNDQGGVRLDIGEVASKGIGDAVGKVHKVAEGLTGASGEMAKSTAKAAETLAAAAKGIQDATNALAQATAKASEPKPEAPPVDDHREYTVEHGGKMVKVTRRTVRGATKLPPKAGK